MKEANAELDAASEDLKKIRVLSKLGSVSDRTVRDAMHRLYQAQAPIERLKARYELYMKAGEGLTDQRTSSPLSWPSSPAKHGSGEGLADPRTSNPLTETSDFFEVSNWGLRLATSTHRERNQLAKTKYRGGMRVLEVISDSPGAKSGIQKDDIFVGLDKWETRDPDNFTWIMNQLHRQVETPGGGAKEVKFYLIRGQESKDGLLPILPDSPAKELND